MKQLNYLLSVALSAVLFSSCESFINDIPKGQKIPTTWSDYNAFIKNSNIYHYFEQDQLITLCGDLFKNPTTVTTASLAKTHYFNEEDVDRTQLASEKSPYFEAYEAIFAWNLIVDDGHKLTECTEAQRDMLVAQARVLRVMNYFYLTNYYADQYCAETVNILSVPLVTSASVEAPSPQVTIGEMYDFMVEDLLLAVDALPSQSEDMLHPNKATGYGMLARVYLSMGDYENALHFSDLALKENNALYDWNAFYTSNQDRIDATTSWSAGTIGNPEKDNPENYIYRFGSMTAWGGLNNVTGALPEHRALQFEEGDLRLKAHWKRRASASGLIFYAGIYSNERNIGGMRSAEMYYIKAECLARTGKIADGIALVNTVRQTRFIPEYYKPLRVTPDETEAVKMIMQDKQNEFCQTLVAYWDIRRMNKDPKYAQTIVKTIGGMDYPLRPDSHLWIMPFPVEVLTNPGNNPVVQNVAQ